MASLVKAAPTVSTVHGNLISLLVFTGCDTTYPEMTYVFKSYTVITCTSKYK